jgi:hypothetical protein
MVLITTKIQYIIWVFHSFTLALVLLLHVSLVALLIGKMPLKKLLYRPVTHIVFKEHVVFLGLWDTVY